MELFDSYQSANIIWCDQTKSWEYPDPTSRILCLELANQCGRDCTKLILENGLILCNCNDSWNCNLCTNDVPFFIPFELGDTFDFQFQQPNEMTVGCVNGWLPSSLLEPTNTAFATFEIRSCCDDAVLEIDETLFETIAPFHYNGFFNVTDYSGNTTQTPIQQIRFNLAAISAAMIAQDLDPCFYFIFNFTGERGTCLPQAEMVSEFCSEPFRAIPCDGKTHVFESYYPKFDCFGTYYSDHFTIGQGTPFAYSNRIRVPSSFERTNFTITKETIGATLKTTSAQYCETWLMRTPHLPETFVKYLVNVFTGRDVYVDGVEYQIAGEISKNNETGSQWFLETNFQRCECDQSLTCS